MRWEFQEDGCFVQTVGDKERTHTCLFLDVGLPPQEFLRRPLLLVGQDFLSRTSGDDGRDARSRRL